jgi:hypothetical protein
LYGSNPSGATYSTSWMGRTRCFSSLLQNRLLVPPCNPTCFLPAAATLRSSLSCARPRPFPAQATELRRLML